MIMLTLLNCITGSACLPWLSPLDKEQQPVQSRKMGRNQNKKATGKNLLINLPAVSHAKKEMTFGTLAARLLRTAST